MYSDLDVERLQLLRRLTARGHSIGQLAKIPLADLASIAGEEEEPSSGSGRVEPPSGEKVKEFRSAAVRAAQCLSAGELQGVLERAAVTLGVPAFLEEVASPSIREIGHGWREGTISVGQEHLATAVFRQVLGWIIDTFEVQEPTTRLLVATPPGQIHELGALLAAATAAAEGWDVVYLGADLPVSDLLNAARQTRVRAVALSVVLVTDISELIEDLKQIRQGLEPQVRLFVGGAAAGRQPDEFRAVGAQVIDTLDEFRNELRRLQEQP